jgi:hypothetical protein
MRKVTQRLGARWLLAVSTGALAMCGLASTASAVELGADDELRYVQRDLVLPEMTVTPFVDMRVIRVGNSFADAVFYSQNIGVKFVPLENLELKASPFSFYAGDGSGYGTVMLGGTYRFFSDDTFEVGVTANVPVAATGVLGGIGMSGGLPIRVHVDDVLRIDTGLFISGLFDTNAAYGGDAQFAIARADDAPFFLPDPGVPLEASFQIVDMIFAGMDTGFGIRAFGDPGDQIFVPLGFRVGANLDMDGRPFVDLTTGFRWPVFIYTGSPDTVEAGVFDVQIVRADFHFDVSDG